MYIIIFSDFILKICFIHKLVEIYMIIFNKVKLAKSVWGHAFEVYSDELINKIICESLLITGNVCTIVDKQFS